MAAVVFRRRNGNSALLINLLKRVLPYRRRSVSNTLFYSTESATSRTEEFSLRYLEGEHEGALLYHGRILGYWAIPFNICTPYWWALEFSLQENRNFAPWENKIKMPTHYSFQTRGDHNDLQFERGISFRNDF